MTGSLKVVRFAWPVATASRLPRVRTALVCTVAAIALLVAGCAALPGLGRPDMTKFSELTLPSANDDRSVRVRFGGASTLLFEVDGTPALMTDGFFSRPGLGTVLTGRIAPDASAICYGLGQMDAEAVPLIVPLHAHYDHAMDAPWVALKTGARLLGDASIRNIARGSPLADARFDTVIPEKPMVYGDWSLTFIPAEHAPTLFRFPGEITQALCPPARVSRWREGQSWTLLVEYASGTTRMKSFLVHASAGYRPGEIARAMAGHCADIVFLGVGGAGHQRPSERAQLWTETVRAANASRVILIHWDDLFQGLDQPLRPMSPVADDFALTLTHFEQLAARDGRDVRLPPLFESFDPYSGLPARRASCSGPSPGGVRGD